MIYFSNIRKLNSKQIKLLDEINNDFSISKYKKGGNNYFINYKNITHSKNYLTMINKYMEGIHNNSLYNYYRDYPDNREANFKTTIKDDNDKPLFNCIIRSIKNEKIIIGTYDSKNNNYAHISFFKDGFIHITFIIPPSKSAGGSPFKIYYNIPPDINNNWDDIEIMLKNLQQLLFINNIINDKDNEFWKDSIHWKELLFGMSEKKNMENKEFIEKQLYQLLQIIDILKRNEEFRINYEEPYYQRSRSRSRSHSKS